MSRVIDKLIAEKVMKVPCFLSQFGHGEVLWAQFEGQDAVMFHPSENIRDAWLVVDKLSKDSDFEIFKDCDDSFYMCEFLYTLNEIYVGKAETAPMAICLAALKVMGVNLETP